MSTLGPVGGSPSFWDEASAEVQSAESSVEATVSRVTTSGAFGPALAIESLIKSKFEAAPAAPLTTTEARVAALEDVIHAGVGATAKSHLPGTKSLTTQALDILKTCKTSAELDAVINKVGRRNLLLALHERGAAGDPVKDFISQMRASDAHPGDWNAYDAYLDQVTGTKSQPGNQVTLLNNGETAFPAIFAALDGAKTSINVETYAFHGDSTGNEYADHSIAAAKRGVAVNFMCDKVGEDDVEPILARLRAGGVNVIVNDHANEIGEGLDHRKVVVVDGSTGFTGGMNIGDSYAGKGPDPWHDMHSKIEGPAVADLQRAFLTRWSEDGGRPAAGVNYFPPLAAKGDQGVRIVPHSAGKDEALRLAYIRAIDTAQKSVLIEDPYMVDPEVLDHLKKAAQRGVDVNLVWPEKNDEASQQDRARSLMPDLIAAGVKCWEYGPSHGGRGMAHEKVASIDGNFATIGSSNLDPRSLQHNNELNIVSTGPKLAGDLERQIRDDIGHAQRMTPPIPKLDISKLSLEEKAKVLASRLDVQNVVDNL